MGVASSPGRPRWPSAVVAADEAGVAIDDKVLDQGIILGDYVGGDRVSVFFLHLADLEPRVVAPGQPAFHAALHVVGGEIERLIDLAVVPGTVTRAIALPHHAGAGASAPTAHVVAWAVALSLAVGGSRSGLVGLAIGRAVPLS